MLSFFTTTKKESNLILEKSKNSYPKIVQEIHNTFYSASDKALEEAKSIIAEAASKNISKVNLLKSFGFKQSREVKELEPILKKSELSKEVVDLIMQYKVKYPMYKFITEEQVQQICFKYNLVCGDVGLYKGFVPQKNLLELDKALKIIEEEGISIKCRKLNTEERYTLFLKDAEVILNGNYFHFYKKGSKERFKYAFQSDDGVSFYGSDRDNLFGYKHLGSITSATIQSNLLICAPVKDMDMKGMTLEHGYKIEKIHIPDPVILKKVKGGYIICTAWGDEASDPIVVNEIKN